MKYWMIILLIYPTISACTAPQPIPTITSQPVPAKTFTPTPTSTSSPATTITPTLVSLPPGREIIFEESGNKNLAGTLYGEGETAILLANMSIGGEKQWDPFVAAVDKQKFTTVTFNYRNVNDVGPDMDVVLGRLKEEGFTRVICIGASLGTK